MLAQHKFEAKECLQAHESLQNVLNASTSFLTIEINYQKQALGLKKKSVAKMRDIGCDSLDPLES